MIIIRGIHFRKIEGIALWPFILVRSRKPSAQILRHERIHLRQQLEMLILPFYLWYAAEWAWKWVVYRNADAAYRNISFEREAYANDHDVNYLKKRKFWSFISYIHNQTNARENHHH